MEEEYGYFEKSLAIVNDGLSHCFNEALATKALKQFEKNFQPDKARNMLGELKQDSIGQVWRTILEGTLFEIRAGNVHGARRLFRYLMKSVSWYGPIYYEAYKLDERELMYESALEIIRRGLKELPRYGPLWFGLLKIMERYDYRDEMKHWLFGHRPTLRRLREEANNAARSITHELIWKVSFEHSQAEERAADFSASGLAAVSSMSIYAARQKLFSRSRSLLIQSALVCPSNLQWKIWLVGSRLELSAGNLSTARKLLCLAFSTVPLKSKAQVFLDASRIEEYCGNLSVARELLVIAKTEIPCEWKLYLEAILLEARSGNISLAMKLAEKSLKQHTGTGRLWSMLIQLSHRLETAIIPESRAPLEEKGSGDCYDDEVKYILSEAKAITQVSQPVPLPSEHRSKFQILDEAVRHVPKSGEVWCEGARCFLNPMNTRTFDLTSSQKYLQFAIQFTPQYGDAFIEYLRLEMILQVLLPVVLENLGFDANDFRLAYLANDQESDVASQEFVANRPQKRDIVKMLVEYERMEADLLSSYDLELRFRKIAVQNLHRRQVLTPLIKHCLNQ